MKWYGKYVVLSSLMSFGYLGLSAERFSENDKVSRILDSLSFYDPWEEAEAKALGDKLSHLWFQKYIRACQAETVFLAIGHSEQTDQDWSAKKKEAVRELVCKLHEHGYIILYDGDSPLLVESVEKEVAGRYRMAIHSRIVRHKKPHQHLTLENPWLRLSCLLSVSHLILSPDSILATGIVLEGIPKKDHPKMHAFEVDHAWHFEALRQWSESKAARKSTKPGSTRAIENFNSPYPRGDFPTSIADFIWKQQPESPIPAVNLARFQKIFLNPAEQHSVLTFAATYANLTEQTEKGLSDGIVVMGSSTTSPLYLPLIKGYVAYYAKQGIPFATGGCGGYMQAVNEEAQKYGAPSIGIPRADKSDTPTELVAFSYYHTRTILVPSYEERIPLLLGRGKFQTVFAPGGAGTIRELATYLMNEATHPWHKTPAMVFLDEDYYWGLVQWLKALPLPSRIIGKISLQAEANWVAPPKAVFDERAAFDEEYSSLSVSVSSISGEERNSSASVEEAQVISIKEDVGETESTEEGVVEKGDTSLIAE